jgi:hypothetical protein
MTMTDFRPHRGPDRACRRAVAIGRTLGLALAALLTATGVWAQDSDPAKETIAGGYSIRQSFEFGGRIVDSSGSNAMYATLVNLQSGPRLLDQSLDMHAVGGAGPLFFDTLTMTNSGYGGDPVNLTTLRMSKGKLYKFQGLFRRDRQYFDYDLLDNPLIPAGLISNGYTFPQALTTPHLFNTVRRMMDVGLTIFPDSNLSFRTGYSHNIDQGPSYSSQHNGAEALYLQNWRNSTDTWTGAVDWKPVAKTLLTYEETVTHYKGDTNWQLAPALPLQLSNGTPVTLGFDNTSLPSCTDGNPPIVTSSTTPPTANPTCPGYLQYLRTSPTRWIMPTEEFRFQSSSIKNVQMNGRVNYTGGNMSLPSYLEFFNGLDNFGVRQFTTTGIANGKRINVTADYGIVWQVSEKVSLSDQVDFSDFRQPALSDLSQVSLMGTSLLLPPGPPQPAAVTLAQTFMGMKTTTNTAMVSWDPISQLTVSLGYRYSARDIRWVMPLSTDALPTGTAYTFPIRENGGIFNIAYQPTRQWRINGSLEGSYFDKAYTQISPRQLYHYRLQTRYKPKEWATITGTFNDIEGRDNIFLVNHTDHNRSVSLAAMLMPNPRYGLDLSYGYSDIFTRTTLCYASSAPLPGPGVGAAPADCGTNTNLGTGYYDAPTQYGSFGVTATPVKQLRAGTGYNISAVNGTIEFLNALSVPGSLQSKYQSPYVNLAWTLHDGLVAKANFNYYGYGEEGLAGPTLPRNFHANMVTLAVRYEF